MRSKQEIIKIICLLLTLQSVTARTILHRRTEIDNNGQQHIKTWTTQEPDDDFATPEEAEKEGFQTFTRNGVTLQIKPQISTFRIGGKNVTAEQLLEQAKYTKQLEPIAVRQLLSTGHPVKRTNIENGHKHTSTYTLEPDGSIVCTKVQEIDMADVERRFEEIFKQQAQKQNPNKINDWEWTDDDRSKETKPTKPTSQQPVGDSKVAEPLPEASTTPVPKLVPQPQAPTKRAFDFGAEPKFGQYPQLPSTWDRNTWTKVDPFNPSELPTLGGLGTDSDYEPIDDSAPAKTETNTFTKTQTDKDGNTLYTTYTSGPNEWKRKIVKITKNYKPEEDETTHKTSTTKTIPSLEDFLHSQYQPNSKSTQSAFTPSTPKIIKTINIDDLPAVALVNLNKPIEEQYLQPLTPYTNGGDQKPIHTIKVENISPSPDVDDLQRKHITHTRTLTKTLNSNQPPSAADLDPNMLEILQNAGIKPEEIINAKGQMIIKTRVEPDGRIVTTTYRIRPTYNIPAEPRRPIFRNSYPEHFYGSYNSPFAAERPSIYGNSPPYKQHQSASHFGVDFIPHSPAPAAPADEPKSTTAYKPLVRDREPLEPHHNNDGYDDDQEDDEDTDKIQSATLNPLHMHPVIVPDSAPPIDDMGKPSNLKSAIAEFLAKLGLAMNDLEAQNGEFVKTIVDADGRTLTARFVLSPRVGKTDDKK